MLLLAVCGAAARFVPSFMGSSTRPKSWVDRAEAMVFQNLGKVDISYLQALAILGFNRAGNHQTGKSFHFVPLMVRMAYLLKLHKEDTKLPLVERECRRRLLWSIFTSDRFYAGGVKVSQSFSLQSLLVSQVRVLEMPSTIEARSDTLVEIDTSATC